MGVSGAFWKHLGASGARAGLPEPSARARVGARRARLAKCRAPSRFFWKLLGGSGAVWTLGGHGRARWGRARLSRAWAARARGHARHAWTSMGGRLGFARAARAVSCLAALPCACARAHGSDGGRWCRAPMAVLTGIWACHGAVSWADTRAVMGTRRGTQAGLVSCPREVPANAVGICRGRPWAVLGPRWAAPGPC